MPTRCSMSVIGLYEYDHTVFDRFHLPGEASEPELFDHDAFVQYLLQECMDLEVLYPDPAFMKDAVQRWSLIMLNSWEDITRALMQSYNPLENYNREESWSDSNTRTDNTTKTINGGTTGGGTVGVTDGSTVTGSSMAFNSNSYKGRDKEETTGSSTTTTSDSSTVNSTETNTGTVGNSATRTGSVHGNIGTVTAQSMALQEVELRMKYQIFNIIVDQFKQKFCLLVY